MFGSSDCETMEIVQSGEFGVPKPKKMLLNPVFDLYAYTRLDGKSLHELLHAITPRVGTLQINKMAYPLVATNGFGGSI